MARLRPRVALHLAVVTAAFTSCAHGPSATELTGQTSSAISGGTNDVYSDPQQQADARIVVRFGGLVPNTGGKVVSVCTGTLLTPTVVLTAGHCYYGFLNDQYTGPVWGARPPVSISEETTDLDPSFTIPTNGSPSVLLTNPNCCSSPQDAADDLALFYLDTGALNADIQSNTYAKSLWKLALETERGGTTLETDTAGRISLQTPARDASGQLQITAGVAGDAPALTFRQVRFFSSGIYDNTPLWEMPPGGTMGPGDSGGPLFQVRADGSREVFGVHSFTLEAAEGFPEYDAWVDITTPSHAAWIQSTLTDHSHDGPGQAHWRSVHPGYLWKGEVEYTGSCRGNDADCDHWTDTHDNCPYIFNPDQKDSNDDGVGDACPSCPCDPNNDIDGDLVCACSPVANGYCDTYCPTATVDNCPFVDNDQSNCNAEAEAARGASVLGDACDPVPCPGSSAPPAGGITCTGEPHIGGRCLGRQLRNQIHTATVGSHISEAIVESTNKPVASPQTYNVGAATDSRFCQSNLSLPQPFNCHAQAVISDAQLQFDVPVNPAEPWHAVTLSSTAGRGGEWLAVYGTTVEDQTWDYAADNSYWFDAGLLPPPDPVYQARCTDPAVPSGTCLNGTFWSHAATLVGSSPENDTVNGVTVGVHGPSLTNHYFDLAPDVPFNYTWATGIPITYYFPWWQDPGDPLGWGVDPGSGVVLGFAGQTGIHLLQQGNQAVDITQHVSTTIASELLDSSLVWASPVEPGTRSGRMGTDLVGVALSADGTTVVDSMLARDGTLVSGRRASSFAGDPPTPRSGFTAVLTRVAGALFVLGGSDPTTGLPLHDIWMQAGGQDWSQIAVAGYQPGQVLAATYSYADHQLWILDRVDAGRHQKSLRLARLDVLAPSPTAQLVAQWPQRFDATGYFLAVDRDGSILLSVGLPGAASRTARISVGAEPRITLLHTEPGRLAHALLVDDFGYSFVVSERDQTLRIERRTRLQGHCCDHDSCGGDDDGDRSDGDCACSFGDLDGRF